MIDIQFIRDNEKATKQACEHKNLNSDVVDNLLQADEKRRDLIQKLQDLKTEANKIDQKTKEAIFKSKDKKPPKIDPRRIEIKKEIKDLEPQLKQAEETFQDLMLQIPNVPLEEVPVGKDESGNKEVRTWGKKPKFNFTPKDHVELGLALNLLDLDRGAKVAGFRGYYLKNDAVLIQNALMQYALKKFIDKGYTPITPPVIDRRQAFINSGHFPWGERESYKLAEDENDPNNDYFLAGTAEVPLVSYLSGETLNEKDLPIKMVGISPCFRREVGNYGKDTKGIYRIHEFVKTEQVIICKNDLDESRQWQEKIMEYSEEIFQDLGLPYRVLLMCTGDMGEPQAKKYDLEVWMPGKNAYGEACSNSIMTDFQSRRANIRYRAKDNSLKFVHMLNNTAIASPRALAMILENYQQKDGSVRIPPVLVPYIGKEAISRA